METLQLTLLGPPQIRLNKKLLTNFTTKKAQALFFYLVRTKGPHSREHLAALFWSDMPDQQAKKNLRTVLPHLRRSTEPYLIINRQTVAFDEQSSH